MLAISHQSRRIVPSSGAIAQLVERMNGIHEVTGSNPVGSTILRTPYGAATYGKPSINEMDHPNFSRSKYGALRSPQRGEVRARTSQDLLCTPYGTQGDLS